MRSNSTLAAVLVAALLAGCASFNTLNSEVSTYGAWPAERRPAGFVFDRLPSQDSASARQTELETAARGALEAAGFRAAGTPAEAEYLVQVGARVVSNDPWVYNAPLFWRGPGPYGWGYGPYRRFGGGYGAGWGGWDGWARPYGLVSFEREVVLLIRDHRNGTVLYEARADNTGPSPDIDYLLPAMFSAALKNFPRVDPTRRKVQTPVSAG